MTELLLAYKLEEIRAIGRLDPARGLELAEKIRSYESSPVVREQAPQIAMLIAHQRRLLRQLDEAELGFREASELARERGDTKAIVEATIGLAQTLGVGGRFQEALDELDAAGERARMCGFTHLEAESLFHRGQALLNLGRLSEAVPPLQRSAQLAGQLGHTRLMIGSVTVLANTLLSMSEYDAALREYERAAELCESSGTSSELPMLYCSIANARAFLGDTDGARRALTQLSGRWDIADRAPILRSVRRVEARIARMTGDHEGALVLLDELAGLAEATRDEVLAVEVDHERALVYIELRRSDEALALLRRTIAAYEAMDALICAVPCYYSAAELLSGIGRHAEAYEYLKLGRDRELEIVTERAIAKITSLEAWHGEQAARADAEAQRLRAESLQSQLERQRTELAAQALRIARQTEGLTKFRDELRAIVREEDSAESALRRVCAKLKELPAEPIDWSRFEAEFQQSFPDFRMRLITSCPELSRMELRICAMIKLRLTSADIASLLCLSERTVDTHRLNIRRKLGLLRGRDLADALDEIG